jgi:hypothetical protein
VRLFVASGDDWNEITSGDQPTVRLAAADLKRAQRGRARIRASAGDVAVILDITVAVARDFRSARSSLAGAADTVHYAGTVDGLAGLIADIEMADVADGVTLIPASPRQDLSILGRDILHRLASRGQARAS